MTTPVPQQTPAAPDATAGLPNCLTMIVALVLALATAWVMFFVVGNTLHERFMPPEHPLAGLDVADCLHIPETGEPVIVPCGNTGKPDAPRYSVQAFVQEPLDCYRIGASEAVLKVDRRVACLGPRDEKQPRSASGARTGQCRSDEHVILGWRSSCSKGSREALLVFRTTDTFDPREQCLARGAGATDLAVATRLRDITTHPATDFPEMQIVCAGALKT